MKYVYWLAFVLVLVGALNLGILGVTKIDLISFLFERFSISLARVIYCLIGISGLFMILYYKKMHPSKPD